MSRAFLALTILAMVLICVVAVGSAFAQSDMKVSGTVESVSSSMIVVRTDTGARTFIIDTDSDLPGNLTTTDRVTVVYREDPVTTDRWLVSNVVVDEPASLASDEQTSLPQTATPLLWIALTGIVALGGFIGLRKKRRAHHPHPTQTSRP